MVDIDDGQTFGRGDRRQVIFDRPVQIGTSRVLDSRGLAGSRLGRP